MKIAITIVFIFAAQLALGQQRDSVIAVPLKQWQTADLKELEKVKTDAAAKSDMLIEFIIKDNNARFDTLKGLRVQDSTLFLLVSKRKKK